MHETLFKGDLSYCPKLAHSHHIKKKKNLNDGQEDLLTWTSFKAWEVFELMASAQILPWTWSAFWAPLACWTRPWIWAGYLLLTCILYLIQIQCNSSWSVHWCLLLYSTGVFLAMFYHMLHFAMLVDKGRKWDVGKYRRWKKRTHPSTNLLGYFKTSSISFDQDALFFLISSQYHPP